MAVVQVKSQTARYQERLERKEKAALTKKPEINEHEIYVTDEYDVFERMAGNRQIDEAHVVNLMKRMKKKDLKVPIQVNQEFQVVDGQHRLEARRRLGLPVYYYATPDFQLEEVQELNAAQKKWTNDDFVSSFIELGYKDYASYRWFRHQYKLPHVQSVLLLSGQKDNKNIRQAFKQGAFRVRDLEGAKKFAEQLTQIAPYFDGWNSSRFVSAMIIAEGKKNFDFRQFMKKVKTFPGFLKPQINIEGYLEHIEELFNYKNTKKVAIRYGEDKE